jgi:MFS family permease
MTNLTLTEMLKTPSAFLMLWACTIVVGSGTMLTNNMGQMTEARGLPNRAAGACLALFSVAQAGARVATGALSESALSWKRVVPRPYFLVMSCLVGLIGHVWLAISNTRSTFVVGIILVGFSFGMVWPLLVLVVGDIFGTTNHGANYMFYDGFTSAIGTLVISKYIAQGVYENHITDEEETTCFGTACFQRTHWIVATLCLSAMISSLVLSQSTKGLYVR